MNARRESGWTRRPVEQTRPYVLRNLFEQEMREHAPQAGGVRELHTGPFGLTEREPIREGIADRTLNHVCAVVSGGHDETPRQVEQASTAHAKRNTLGICRRPHRPPQGNARVVPARTLCAECHFQTSIDYVNRIV